MNKNLNLVDILKDCPKGYKLYSTIHGEVKFEGIINDKNYPIVFKYSDIACEFHVGNVTKDGRYKVNYDGECTLFPEKHQRDWAKFKVEPEMIDGEFYYCNYEGRKYIFIYKEKEDLYKTNNYAIIKINDLPFLLKQNAPIYCGYLAYFDELRNATEEEKQLLLNVIKKEGYKWDEEEKKLMKIESELVDGEIYYTRTDLAEWIYMYKRNDKFKTNHYVALMNGDFLLFDNICTTHAEDIKVLRKATEEEKRMLFKMIKENGRKWNADKKELVRIGEKFNISTLQPFDKVLVRDNDAQSWRCNFYNSYAKSSVFPFICVHGINKQCIPYNEETKHLVSSNELPPEKYIIWGNNYEKGN